MHYIMQEAVNRSFNSGPCYCQWPIQPSGGSAAWPKFNTCKLVTQCPLVGWIDTMEDWGGRAGSLKVKVLFACMTPLSYNIGGESRGARAPLNFNTLHRNSIFAIENHLSLAKWPP